MLRPRSPNTIWRPAPILALIICLSCGLAAAEPAFDPVIPLDPTAHDGLDTEARLLQRRRAFFKRLFVDAYDRHGRRGTPLDDKIRPFLDRAGDAWGSYSNMVWVQPDMVRCAEELEAAGCDDPLVLYLIGTLRGSDASAASFAKVYPALTDLGYDGVVRAMISHSLLHAPDRIDEAKRQELLRAEEPHRLDWLLDPALDHHPEAITEKLEDLGWVPESVTARLAYWRPLLADPAAWPAQHAWRLHLVHGIAHLASAEAAQGIWDGTRELLSDVVRRERIRKDPHFGEAIRELRKAEKANPADGQASAWLLRAAISDPSIRDASALIGRAISRQSCMMTAMSNYWQWLEVHHSDDAVAAREAAMACTAFGNQYAPTSPGLTQYLLSWIDVHRDRAKDLLDDRRLYRALAEYRWLALRRSSLSPDQYAFNSAKQAILLWLMGHKSEAEKWMWNAGDKELQGVLKRDLPITTLDAFKKDIEADPILQAIRNASKIPPDQACTMLEPLLSAEQPDLDDTYVFFAAFAGRRQEAVARIERTIGWAGHCGRDILIGTILTTGTPTPAEVDTAFARMAEHASDMIFYGCIFTLTTNIAILSEHDRLLALVRPEMIGRSNAFDLAIAIPQLDTIDGAQNCAEILSRLRRNNAIAEGHRGRYAILLTLAARIADRPDLAVPAEDLRQLIGTKHIMPEPPLADALLSYCAGDIDRATAIARSAGVKYPDEIHLYLVFDAIARKQTALVEEGLGMLLKHAGQVEWVTECGRARRIQAWLSGQAKPPITRDAGF